MEGLLALALLVDLLLLLERKGALARDDTVELCERVLFSLEQQQAEMPEPHQAIYAQARALLEALRARTFPRPAG